MDEKKRIYKRKTKLIKIGLQFRFMVIVLLLMFLTGIIVAWGTYCLDRAIVYQLVEVNIFKQLMAGWVLLLLAIGIGFSILVSHRIAGPIYRFEKVLDRLAKGELDYNVSIRKKDELQELAQKFDKAVQYLRQEILKEKSNTELISKQIEEIAGSLSNKSLNTEGLVKIGGRLKELSSQIKTVNSHFTV